MCPPALRQDGRSLCVDRAQTQAPLPEALKSGLSPLSSGPTWAWELGDQSALRMKGEHPTEGEHVVRGSHDTHEAPGGAQSRTRKPRPRPWVKRRQPTWVFTQSVGVEGSGDLPTVPAHPR